MTEAAAQVPNGRTRSGVDWSPAPLRLAVYAARSWRRGSGGRRRGAARRPRDYLMKSISEYLGSGQRSSATSFSRRSATSRTSSMALITASRM
jgi:hypothetical protein